jgi:2-haloacid dehalogenase
VTYLFDVNETLLDLAGLDEPVFGGDVALRRRWFSQTLQSALVLTVLGGYRPFGEVAAGALRMVAPAADPAALRAAMAALPAHPDVRRPWSGCARTACAWPPSPSRRPTVLERQLRSAGIDDLFDATFSADDAGRLKPAPEPYRHALAGLGTADVTMVAAHAWDVAGAHAAGLGTVLVARPGVVPDPSLPGPGRVVADLRELER